MRYLIVLACLLGSLNVPAQRFEVVDPSETGAFNRVWTNSFWSDWYLQADLDMSLQNPYGYNFSHVFLNGKSFGLDLALGKWFTPQVGIRAKLNWENALPLLKNDHLIWLAPFDQPGVNREKGGYLAFYGDMLINLHHLFGTYQPDRTWNLSVYPRIGVNYNFGVSKGALLAGFGIQNTYRLSDRWSLLLDIAYVMTGSGFVGTEEVENTGTGSNSNGYFSIGLGAQLDLGKSRQNSHAVKTNRFWHNWYVQMGLDMSLMNPYGCNFSEVFPKGKTFGLNGAIGKWFTPEFALRGRLYWENGILKNNHLEWVPPTETPEDNFNNGGGGIASIEVL